jgi:DNA-binding FadR family transcriptional regulator
LVDIKPKQGFVNGFVAFDLSARQSQEQQFQRGFMKRKRPPATTFRFQELDIRRPSDLVADAIARAVYLFDIQVGEKLPSELQLSRQLGVNRTVLRGGLKKLSEQGILKIQPGAGGGAFVIARPKEIPSQAFGSTLVPLGNVVDVLIARRAIEPRILELASAGASEEDLQIMSDALEPLSTARLSQPLSDADVELLSSAALKFNIALGRATHVKFLENVMQVLTELMEPVRRVAIRQNPEAAVDTLRQTLDAINRGDPQLIKAVLERRFDYLERAWENETGRRLWRELPSFLPNGRNLIVER